MAMIASRPRLEVADILRAHGNTYRAGHPVSPEQATVMHKLVSCRTAALGGHVDACDRCGFAQVSYNSCRDRHCPKCQTARQTEWLETRLERLLPIEYFHVVFTLPEQLRPLALKNRRVIYNLLFQAASATLLQLAADPRRLAAQIGFTALLHTWSQNLLFHPHLHCVVTGGGLSADGGRWVPARPAYLFPVKVLARLFRGKFLAGLSRAYQDGRLAFHGSTTTLASTRRFQQLLNQLYRQDWVVYAKPPFGGAERVFRYLARYTHRVAISNHRLVALSDGRVRFRYKDYADAQRSKEMSLSAEEFIRRFLLHVLPKRFVRIRHYGLLAARNVTTKLQRCRQLLSTATTSETPRPATSSEPSKADSDDNLPCCPLCHGPLRRTRLDALALETMTMVTLRASSRAVSTVPILDSS